MLCFVGCCRSDLPTSTRPPTGHGQNTTSCTKNASTQLNHTATNTSSHRHRHHQSSQEVARDILGEQSAKRLYQVRGKLYELLANCIPPELLLRALLLELLKKLDDEVKAGAVELAALYEHRLQEGQKAIFHLEAFVAKFMSLYKNWQLSAFG